MPFHFYLFLKLIIFKNPLDYLVQTSKGINVDTGENIVDKMTEELEVNENNILDRTRLEQSSMSVTLLRFVVA